MKKLILAISFLCASILYSSAQEVVHIAPHDGDMTPTIRAAIDSATSKDIKIVLEAGTYFCRPDYAFDKYCAVTNHGNGLKKILFPMIGYNSVSIEGNGATILCHGHIMPFLFEECGEIAVDGVTVDWDIPFTFLAEVIAVDAKEGWREVKPMGKEDGFNWEFKKEILFPNIDGFNYQCLGSTLPFDATTKRVVAGAIDCYSNPTRVEKLKNGNLKIYEKLRYQPPVGSLLSSKGDREHDRYAPAFEFKECDKISIDHVTVHHAPGMGFLFERSANITLKNSQVVLKEGSRRVISSTADATHFANCKGDILIEGCRFENMLDDGTNVHGTYAVIDQIVDRSNVVIELMHFEQLGFKFAEAGEQMWFISKPSPLRLDAIGTVAKVEQINEKYCKITFAEPMPCEVKEGYILENKTWNPTFTMRGCTIQNHRARNVVLKSPLKTVIENNYFSGMMSSILFRGELYFWYESGGVEDVLIQHNTFHNVADCGTPHATLYITPRFNEEFDPTIPYDRNIRFVNNTINTSNPKIVWADRVDGLLIEGNKIEINTDIEPSFPNEPTYNIENSRNVVIKNNTYKGEASLATIRVDQASSNEVTIKKNKIRNIE
ncbi:MAG: right-handed parallel beta-helix repeat-containing protein [Rikenellaceae bacterium]